LLIDYKSSLSGQELYYSTFDNFLLAELIEEYISGSPGWVGVTIPNWTFEYEMAEDSSQHSSISFTIITRNKETHTKVIPLQNEGKIKEIIALQDVERIEYNIPASDSPKNVAFSKFMLFANFEEELYQQESIQKAKDQYDHCEVIQFAETTAVPIQLKSSDTCFPIIGSAEARHSEFRTSFIPKCYIKKGKQNAKSLKRQTLPAELCSDNYERGKLMFSRDPCGRNEDGSLENGCLESPNGHSAKGEF